MVDIGVTARSMALSPSNAAYSLHYSICEHIRKLLLGVIDVLSLNISHPLIDWYNVECVKEEEEKKT